MVMGEIETVMNKMISYFAKDPVRVNHFLKVYGFAKTIGELEGLDSATQKIVEIAAITHDIGIKNSEKKYNSASGQHQQIEGPPEAKKLLAECEIMDDVVERVCWLIAHHHTYTDVNAIDYQILIEADFLVNAYEDKMSNATIMKIKEKLFKTISGKTILENLYL